MWNSNKSLQLSRICTKLVMVLVVVCAILLPYLIDIYRVYSSYYTEDTTVKPFMAILYSCCVPALIALFSLDRLLTNISREQVFTGRNVGYLRRISWCCFAVAGMVAVAGYYYYVFFFGAIMAAFMGLILRVVKNVIEQAMLIKAENDYTI
ncbi:DUF2975 domain-containing protein [Clostridium aminobutyricum]|uniref:DUF2975 domain-containing protein n=1 Tax=Clostridium aminobutyricum TaxID=33953 RepID=A0A939IJE2_CLOAM|nr:DUF2975 domain-containing protein [Clostridium aminobutyricum]MBN7773518.1 DUF2975 domain-containing protein [Clostridium aminobutyricum]